MDKTTQKSGLFEEFNPVSKADWIEAIKSHLKGKDYVETLVKTLEDDLRIEPVYHRDDLQDKPPVQSSKAGNRWRKRQNFVVEDWQTARQKVEDIRNHQFDRIGLYLEFDFSGKALGDFLLNVAVEGLIIYFGSDDREEQLLEAIRELPEELLAKWRGGLDLNLDKGHPVLAAVMEAEKDARTSGRSYSLLHVNGDKVQGQTDSVIEEVSEIIARVAAICEAGLEAGLSAEQVRDNLRITVSTSKDYFTSIARIRALRMLVANVFLAFDAGLENADQFQLIGANTFKDRSEDDPYKNLLSHTTQGLSAVSAGVDELALDTMDSDGERSLAFFERLNRNIQWLLATESHLTLVADPLAGSYYIETLTNQLAEKAWEKFQEKMA